MGQIIKIDYQNRPQYLCRLYKDRVAFNSYRKCLVIEFCQMKLLTHENVTLYGGRITCLLACDGVCSTGRYIYDLPVVYLRNF